MSNSHKVPSPIILRLRNSPMMLNCQNSNSPITVQFQEVDLSLSSQCQESEAQHKPGPAYLVDLLPPR